ncbi:MAG: serine/threonine-protein kinase, partial [Planctomycetota bacterium]
ARDVAIKILFPQTAKGPGYVQRFFREARMAARVKHTNIIAAYDVGEHQGLYYLVMEHFPGRTLKTIIFEEDRVELWTALDIGLQIAQALEHAHTHKLMHRDIKPENILINDEGVAKLCDMGLAKELRAGAEDQKEVAGTPLYISPEQASGAKDIDIRSDIYSLGATLHHMILGRPPFLGTDPHHILRMHMEEALVPPVKRDPSLPVPISDLIVKMMAKNPEDRFPHPTALIAQMERVKSGMARPAPAPSKLAPAQAPEEPMETEAPPAVKAKTKWGKRESKSMAPVWIGVALIAILMGGAAFVFLSDRKSPKEDGGKTSRSTSPRDRVEKGVPDKKGTGDDGSDPSPPPSEPDPAEKLFREAEAYRNTNPHDVSGAVSRYRKAAEAGKDSPLGKKALGIAERLLKEKEEEEKALFEKAQSEAAAFEEQGRIGWAMTVYKNFLLRPGLAASWKEKTEDEIDRLETNLSARWQVDEGSIEEMAGRGAFDEAEQVIREAIDRDRGYATREILKDQLDVDVDTLLVDLGKRKSAWIARTTKEAGPRLAALEKKLETILTTGLLGSGSPANPLPLLDRFRGALRLCDEALADPALTSVFDRCKAWRRDLAGVIVLTEKAGEGFRVLAKKKSRVKRVSQPKPSRIAGYLEKEGKGFVEFTSPAAMLPVDQALAELDERGFVTVLEAGATVDETTPEEYLALGLLFLCSTPGKIDGALNLAKENLTRAGAGGLDTQRYLIFLEGRKGAWDEASARKKIEEALEEAFKLAASSDKKKRQAALARFTALLKEHGKSPVIVARRGEIDKAIANLKRKVGPTEEIVIPFLAGKVTAYDAKAKTFEVVYDFAKPKSTVDWVMRTHGNLPDAWFQHALDNFLGRKPVVQLRGKMAHLTGGGHWVWKPRLCGDLEVELDVLLLQPVNVFILFFASDKGGYGLHPDIDLKGLSDYAQKAGMTIPVGADAGLSYVNLNWPQKVTSLVDDPDFTFHVRTRYKILLLRKGDKLTAAVSDKRSRLLKKFEISDTMYDTGRLSLAIIKSGLTVDNIRIQGTFEEVWFKKALDGREGEETGDMPGHPVQ